MVRRSTFIALALVVALVGMVSMASAAQYVANTSQKGSLLIWPKIIVQQNAVDTIVFMANDYFQDVWVKCYWVDWDQQIEDFMLRLTPNQPIAFSAATGASYDMWGLGVVTVPPFTDGNLTGELKCWAVNDNGDSQLSFNHLYGNAWINTEDAGVVYDAYAFAAKTAFGTTVGTGGTLLLNGTTQYDACPQYLVFNFVPAGTMLELDPDLTLVPCKQDLRQDRSRTCTKAKFDVWNSNETKFTGAYQCMLCWWEGLLDHIGTKNNQYGVTYNAVTGYGGDKFTYFTLKTWAARFRAQGVASTVCKNKFLRPDPLDPTKNVDRCSAGAVASPLLGLMLYVDNTTDFLKPYPYAGYTPAGAGLDGTGFIYWDPQITPVPEAPKK
jgi:hypothetical protein